jgi:hypothetical protein
MKHRLDFAYLTILPNNIVEIVIDNDIVLSLEMVEACHEFVVKNIKGGFSLLINRIHDYSIAFEAQLSVASHEDLKAIAFVYYNSRSEVEIEDLIDLRKMDNWNVKTFSGLELGWQSAHQWLEHEMETSKVS